MAKLLLTALAALACAAGVVVLLGARLPEKHVASRSTRLAAAPAEVFAAISDFAAAPQWRKDLERVDVDTAGARLRFTEVSGSDRLTMEVEESLPPTRLVTRIVGEGLPFGGAWAVAVAPEGDGSRITVTEHGEVYNPLFRFVSRYVMGHTKSIDTYLTSLATKFGSPGSLADAEPVPLVPQR